MTTAAGSGYPTYADGLASVAGFESPLVDAVDTFGNVFVAEFTQYRIRKISSAGLYVHFFKILSVESVTCRFGNDFGWVKLFRLG